ncbi:SNF1-interacting protein [Ciborinia camelliae]|nr:SNF1-interacting protein [Ciborinia camelliae]
MGHQQSSMNPPRGDPHGDRHRHHDGGTTGPTSRSEQDAYPSRTGRSSRRNLVASLVSGGLNNEGPERKETRAEAKARKLERERIARIEERERSIKEEHVDGGYLVTMGVYIGPEDFNKAIVRQLMIERRVAPFWRGLEDYQKDWTEHQLVAAGRGLPIPAADEVPAEDIARPHSSDSPDASSSNLQNLMVPLASLTQSTSYDNSVGLSQSHPAFNSSSPASPLNAPATSTSLLRPRSKTLGLKSTSKEPSAPGVTQREIQLPKDNKVNGHAIEAFLYKDSVECSICLIWYPPYLNRTRCCDQSICSECFVQIKRQEPHPPEHHESPPASPDAQQNPAKDIEWLVSEPAACPYCQQPDFGVTYEPPPFRRGLVYTNPSPELANFSSAMSSSSSINSPLGLAPRIDRRRATSLSANDSHVITTDRIRPDWSTKLEAANLQRAKRSAAASALHAAAFVLPGATENRGFVFSRSRFGRHRSDNSPEASETATPPHRDSNSRIPVEQLEDTNGARRRRENLEDLMMAEAIRLSIAAEEERKKKADKEAAKEAAKQAKKQAKEDKKKDKKERKSVYGVSGSSASSSALNLVASLTGRKRGNSNASHLATEVTPEEVEEPVRGKGKGVDRPSQRNQGSDMDPLLPGAQHSDPSTSSSLLETHQSIPSPTAPDRPSHLRQMSTASSASSSLVDSGNGTNAQGSSASIESPGATGTSYEGNEDGDAGTEPLFNFRSLTAMVETDDDEKRVSADHVENSHKASGSRHGSRDETASQHMDVSIETIRAPASLARLEDVERTHTVLAGLQIPDTNINANIVTPQLMITPDTPAVMGRAEENGKQLGSTFEHKANAEIAQ